MEEDIINKKKPKVDLKVFLILAIAIILVIIIAIFIFYLLKSSEKAASEIKLNLNESESEITLEEGGKVDFVLDDGNHSLRVDSFQGDRVNFTLQSEPIEGSLNLGEESSYDLNGDGVNDITVKFTRVDNGKPVLGIREYSEVIVVENDVSGNGGARVGEGSGGGGGGGIVDTRTEVVSDGGRIEETSGINCPIERNYYIYKGDKCPSPSEEYIPAEVASLNPLKSIINFFKRNLGLTGKVILREGEVCCEIGGIIDINKCDTEFEVYKDYLGDEESQKLKVKCKIKIALNNRDISLCSKISDDSYRQLCIDSFPTVLNSINIEEIPKKYKPLNEPKDYNLYPRTKLIQKKTYNSLGDGYSTSDEIHLSAISPEECDKIKNENSVAGNNIYAMCIRIIADISGDYNICKLYSEDIYSLDNCASIFAKNRGDLRPCFFIEKDKEYGRIVNTFTDCVSFAINEYPSEEGCNLLLNNRYQKTNLADYCFSRLAYSTTDYNWCESISSTSIKNSCYIQLVVKITDVDICNLLQNPENSVRELCLAGQAALISDENSCSKLSSLEMADKCHFQKAFLNKKGKFCNLISDSSQKSTCFRHLLWETKDISVCEDPINPYKEACYKIFNAYVLSSSDCNKIPLEFADIKEKCYLYVDERYNS